MKSYPCIGGPLNGQKVDRSEFASEYRSYSDIPGNSLRPPVFAGDIVRPQGPLFRHANDYVAFNRTDRRASVPSMVWLYRGLLP